MGTRIILFGGAFCFFLISLFCYLKSCEAKATSISIAVAEGWPIAVSDSGEFTHLSSNTRLAIMIGIPLTEKITFVVKPRIVLKQTNFKPQPGLILGTSFKLTDGLGWAVGILYQCFPPYDDKTRHLLSLGTGPVVRLTDSVSYTPSVAGGRFINGSWSLAVVPIEFSFQLF